MLRHMYLKPLLGSLCPLFFSARAALSSASSPWPPTTTTSQRRLLLRPPYSVFRSPTSAWKDRLRAQVHAQQQRRQRSPFVQQQYQRFVRQHPEIFLATSTGTRTSAAKSHFAPYAKSPLHSKPRAIPAFSYLKERLLKKNDPQATARRNSLLQAQRRHQPVEQVGKVRVRRRHSHRPLQELVTMSSSTSPKRLRVEPIVRFSRRRQLTTF